MSLSSSPAPHKRKAEVLDEESYLTALQDIIRRDYFPLLSSSSSFSPSFSLSEFFESFTSEDNQHFNEIVHKERQRIIEKYNMKRSNQNQTNIPLLLPSASSGCLRSISSSLIIQHRPPRVSDDINIPPPLEPETPITPSANNDSRDFPLNSSSTPLIRSFCSIPIPVKREGFHISSSSRDEILMEKTKMKRETTERKEKKTEGKFSKAAERLLKRSIQSDNREEKS
jgi:hypothetical protein